MAKNKMTHCKSCGHEISAKGKVTCPSCGRVNKKPIYKRVWFIALVVIVVLSVIANMGSNDSTSTPTTSNTTTATSKPIVEEKIDPVDVTVKELIDMLEDNALKAKNTYDGMYVRVTGELSVIDASGKYFSLQPSNVLISFINVLCFIDEEHLDTVMEFQVGQTVTVIGEITDVGEVMGYKLDVESIE